MIACGDIEKSKNNVVEFDVSQFEFLSTKPQDFRSSPFCLVSSSLKQILQQNDLAFSGKGRPNNEIANMFNFFFKSYPNMRYELCKNIVGTMLFLLTSKMLLMKNLQVVLFWAWKSLGVLIVRDSSMSIC